MMLHNWAMHPSGRYSPAYPLSYSAPMYIDLKKTEVTRAEDGSLEEREERYDKIFLCKVRYVNGYMV